MKGLLRLLAATGRILFEIIAMIRWLLTTFIAVAVLSACWPWLRKLGIGRMPGDFTLRMFGKEYPFPFMSTVVLSLILSLIARVL
jgi:hypothetical protein